MITRRTLFAALVGLTLFHRAPGQTTPAQPTAAVDGIPLIRQWFPPEYPPEALKQGVSGVVMVRIVVDEKGAVSKARVLEADDPRLGEAAVAAAKKWIFSPALDAGRPVPYSMDAPVEFFPGQDKRTGRLGLPPPSQSPQPSDRTPASPGTTTSADYPDSLLPRKLSGTVRFRCVVSPQGHASHVRVVFASHPDFVIPAMLALDQWQFTPGMQGDVPVESELGGAISFDPVSASVTDVLAANGMSSPGGAFPKNPPDPQIISDPIFPFDLLVQGESGSASVTYTVDEKGRPKDIRVKEATKPGFASALVAAVDATVFVSASDGQRAVEVPIVQHADFVAPASDADDTDPVARLVKATNAKLIGGPQGLDERLTPIYRVAPEYPSSLRSGGAPGRAEIEFIIDREGRCRIPRIVSASSDEFGWSAATAVAQWVFKAPLRGGKPTDVRVRVPFEFKAPPKG